MAIETVPYDRSDDLDLSGEEPSYQGVAYFNVGDSCFCIRTEESVRIVGGYWLRKVHESKDVIAARWGYVVEAIHHGENYFSAAGDLLDADCRPRHIRLIQKT